MPQASTPWMELFFVYYSLYRSMDWYAVHGVIDMASQSQPANLLVSTLAPSTTDGFISLDPRTGDSNLHSTLIVGLPAFSVGESVSCRTTTLCDGALYLRPVSARTRLYFAHPNLFSLSFTINTTPSTTTYNAHQHLLMPYVSLPHLSPPS